MRKHEFKYTPGIYTGGILVLAGIVLQAALGSIGWELLNAPYNLIVLVVYLLLLIMANSQRKLFFAFHWLGSSKAATTSIGWVVFVTVIMGLIRQEPERFAFTQFPGWHHLLTNWSFVLVYIWMTTSLGMAILGAVNHFHYGKIPFLLNHVGLFIVLTAGVLGTADIDRWEMKAYLNQPTKTAMDDFGYIHEPPFQLTLKSFDIEEYEPKLMVINANTGAYIPASKPATMVLDKDTRLGNLNGWDICVISVTDSNKVGSCATARITVSRPGRKTVQGEVSAGNLIQDPKFLQLEDNTCIVMPEREPRSFVSRIEISTMSRIFEDEIAVNKPGRVDGWKIYQKNYDRQMGRWSEYSVFEIVRNPWRPVVYIGMFLMMLGAISMFVQYGRKKEEGKK